MSVMYIVFAIGMLVAAAAVGAFIWATRRGQFDDLDTPGVRVLLEDDANDPCVDQPSTDAAPARPE